MEVSPAHASDPVKGTNPAFANEKVIDAIPRYIIPENNKSMVLCTVIQVDIRERAFGVSESKGDLPLTIGALYEVELDKLQKNLEDIALAQAGKYGLKVSLSYNDTFSGTAHYKESFGKILNMGYFWFFDIYLSTVI